MNGTRWVGVVCAFGALVATTTPARGDADPITPGSWTLAILPDTQVYAQSFPQHYTAQTQWLVDHAVSHNIQYVLHEGDIVNNNNVPQWNNALASMNVLNGVLPYAMAPGNHDYGTNGSANNRDSLFNSASYFGPGSFYANQSSIGGFYEAGKTDNAWHTFNAGGQDWLVLALEFGPRDDVVTWANQVVTNHPDHLAMLVTHAYMYYDETRYDWATKNSTQSWSPYSYGVASGPGGVNDGEELWDKLVSQHDNFRFTFNGHVLSDGTGYMADTGVNGNVVHQMLANYQFLSEGGQGYMRLLEFMPDGDTVKIRTYSPVLDGYDTDFDQQFTVSMTQLPPPPPVLYQSVAANIVVGGPTAPTENTVQSVTIAQSGQPQFGTLQINRGDYQLALETKGGLKYQDGVLLATITQNQRDGYRAVVEAGRNSFSDGILTLSVMQAGIAGTQELNVNTSVAWFDFAGGWTAAHVNGNGALAAAGGGVAQNMIARTATGRYTLDLGVNSQNDGLLFTIGNNNNDTIVPTGVLPGGAGWEIRVQDAGTDFPTSKDADFSFLYLPYDTDGLIGGLYDGDNAASISSVGDFAMQRLGVGRYRLTVNGETPDSGMLLLTVAKQATNGVTAPDDNILTYESDGLGNFLIESRDLTGLALQNTHFAWAFMSFDDPLLGPLAPLDIPGDVNGDGTVDIFDVAFVSNHWGETGPDGDANGDGAVDIFDVAMISNNWGATAPATGVPEPETALLALLALPAAALLKRTRWGVEPRG